jgi:phage shock protein G
MEWLFALGVIATLCWTGLNGLGVILAFVMGLVIVIFFGLLAVVLKALPWIFLGVIAIWIYRYYRPSTIKKMP